MKTTMQNQLEKLEFFTTDCGEKIPFKRITQSDTAIVFGARKNPSFYIPNQAAYLSKLPLTKRERPRPGSPTQLALARKGEMSAEMHYAALCESISVSQLEEQLDCYALPQLKAKLLPILNRCERISGETVRKEIASRRAVLPLNFLHPEARPMVIGKQFKTKINANIGTSDTVRADSKKEEIVKLTERTYFRNS